MDGSLKATLPRSGFVQQANQQGLKTAGCSLRSILACYLGVEVVE
jgi:hypothetical protein